MVAVDRRIGTLFAVFLALLLLAGVRSVWLGTVRSHDLKRMARAQQVEDVPVPARRGTITDRNGVELAVSESSITVFANPRLIKDPGGTASKLAPFMGRPWQDLDRKLSDRTKGFVYLARKLPLQKGALVEKLRMPGIGTTEEPRRVYPQGPLAGQLLGGVGTDNKGLSGLESSLNKTLAGEDGKRRIVNDALGKPVNIVDVSRAQAGKDVHLTIDANIQRRVESILAGVGQTFTPKGATALVLDPRDGSILALANWPAVDTSKPGGPSYVDRAVQGNYEPGSTFKAITVSGALEERLITPNTVFDLPVNLQVADRSISDAEQRGPETLNVAQILAQSSNVGAVKIGLRLQAHRFDKWVRRFGFGAGTGIDLPGEQAGIVLRPDHYSGSSMGNMPMGQGIAVTPIQMAAAYEAFADHGVIHRPHVIQGDPAPARRVISRKTAGQVSRMLEGVLAPGGTAQEAQVAGYTLAGKTGTAQKALPNAAGYSKSDYIASFIGFAPARNPRLLVAVMVDTPRGSYYGGVVAAPVFQKIVSFALPYLRIPPS